MNDFENPGSSGNVLDLNNKIDAKRKSEGEKAELKKWYRKEDDLSEMDVRNQVRALNQIALAKKKEKTRKLEGKIKKRWTVGGAVDKNGEITTGVSPREYPLANKSDVERNISIAEGEGWHPDDPDKPGFKL